MAEAARQAAGLGDAFLLYIPAARSPLKASGPNASDRDRVEMLGLALGKLPNSGIWTDEIERSGTSGTPSFTVDTLRRLRSLIAPEIRLRLLIGADQALDFHRWREPKEILLLAPAIVMLRGGMTDRIGFAASLGKTGQWAAHDLLQWSEAIVDIPRMNVSATRVRELLARDRTEAEERELKSMLDPEVLDFVLRHGLYQPT